MKEFSKPEENTQIPKDPKPPPQEEDEKKKKEKEGKGIEKVSELKELGEKAGFEKPGQEKTQESKSEVIPNKFDPSKNMNGIQDVEPKKITSEIIHTAKSEKKTVDLISKLNMDYKSKNPGQKPKEAKNGVMKNTGDANKNAQKQVPPNIEIPNEPIKCKYPELPTILIIDDATFNLTTMSSLKFESFK